MRTSALLCLSLLAFTACVEGLRYFQDPDNIWNVDVSGSPVHPNSANIMQFVVNNGGFAATNNEIRIDFSVVVNVADSNTPRYPITKSGYNNEECDSDVPNGFPLPSGGAVEGGGSPSPSYTGCSGDCHVLVYHPEEAKLYESYQSNFDGSSLSTSCVVQWNLCHKYGLEGRGEQCTSVEAAGLSFTAGVVRPSEVANDDLNHAMRLVLANSMIGKGSVAGKNQYVHPATHAGGPTATDANAPLYGTRFRLKASKDLSGLSKPLQVIGNALKKYGLIIADGTGVPAYSFIFELDGFDSVTWDSLGVYQKVLSDNGITASDFEVVEQPDYPTVITYEGNCQLLAYPTDTCTITNGTSPSGSGSGSGSSSSAGCMLKPSFAELL